MNRPIKEPSAEHPISVSAHSGRIQVRAGNRLIADSTDALVLLESNYPAVFYLPRTDVDMSLLERSDHHSYCPYKGDCSYFSIPSAGERSTNAVWSYEAPYPAVSAIKNYLAFYPDRVDAIEASTAG